MTETTATAPEDAPPSTTITVTMPNIFTCHALVKVLQQDKPGWLSGCWIVPSSCAVRIAVSDPNYIRKGTERDGAEILALREVPSLYLQEVLSRSKFRRALADVMKNSRPNEHAELIIALDYSLSQFLFAQTQEIFDGVAVPLRW